MAIDKFFRQGDRLADRTQANIERELIRAYQASLRNVRAEIAVMYERFADSKGLVSFEGVQKYNRLTNLERNINKEIGKLTGNIAVKTRSGIKEMYELQYFHTAFALEKEVNARLGFGLLDPKAIEAVVDNPLDRVGFLQRNRDNQARLARQMREQLTQGLIQGKSYGDVAAAIKERMDVGATNVMRIARTEMHRAQTQGRLAGFETAENAGLLTRRIWTSTLDADTRPNHQDMDGVAADEDGVFTLPDGSQGEGPGLIGVPEHDIHCRCTVRLEIVGYEPEVRRAREIEGRRGEIIEYKTYNEWFKGRIAK